MSNPLLGQILGGVFANAMRGRAQPGPFGGGGLRGGGLGSGGGGLGGLGGLGGAALGGLLGGLMRHGGNTGGMGGGLRNGATRRGPGGGMLLALLLPIAIQWVQRNGGIGAVVDRFRQKGLDRHADSWVSTGENQPIEAEAVNNVVGREELSRIASQLGVPEDEVAQGFAEILPEVTNQLSPEGRIAPEADDALNGGLSELEKSLREIQPDTHLA